MLLEQCLLTNGFSKRFLVTVRFNKNRIFLLGHMKKEMNEKGKGMFLIKLEFSGH